MMPRRRASRIPIVEDSDISDESTTSHSPVDTIIPAQNSSQDQSFLRSSQRSLNFEISPDFVELTPPSRKKKTSENSTSKPNDKRAQKLNDKKGDPDFEIKTPKKASSRRKRVSQSLSQNSDEETSIYFLIKDNKLSLENIADNWTEKYNKNKEDAFQILIQFFIDLSDYKGRITREMRTQLETTDLINKMSEEFDEENSMKYPLIKAGQKWKDFRENICEFLHVLVHRCHENKILFDKYLLENVISFLIPLSESKVRSFRHTATLAAMKLTTALLDVVMKIFNNLSMTTGMFEGERQALDANLEELKYSLTKMLESIFEHRFKDIRPEVRAICMEEMGLWMQKLHQDFLDDNYLKYIGWNLHDSSGDVRLKCVQALQPLYASEDFYPKLENFTIRFKERMVNMTHDKVNDVAVVAVKIMISILKYEPNLLTDEDNEKMFELVFESYQPLARAAGEYLNKCLMGRLDKQASGEVRSLDGKLLSSNTPLIRDLVLFYTEAQVPGHGDLLVDSLMETNEMMTDWKCMTDLLLEETGPKEEDEESVLIDLMVCCIKQAATGEIPEWRVSASRGRLSRVEQKQIEKNKEKLTKHFIQTLPLLLSKYNYEPKKLANLLAIPQYFDMHIYAKFQEEEKLVSLINEMQMITETVDDSDVLDTVAKTLTYMCKEGHPNFARCDLSRSRMIDRIFEGYKTILQVYRTTLEENEEIDEDLLFNVTHFFKQVALFYMNHDLNRWDIWDSLFKNLVDTYSMTGPRRFLPNEAVKYCVTSCYFSLLWSQRHLIDCVDSDSQIEEKCKVLRTRLDAFMELMCNFISRENVRTPISAVLREDAYIAFCDLLAIFCNKLQSHPNPLMHQLIYIPTPMMQNMMQNFLQQVVFVGGEDEEVDEPLSMEELNKRRNFLASYCKLIIYDMVPAREAVFLLKYYAKYNENYGVLIKETLIKTRNISKQNCALIMENSLKIIFAKIVAEKGQVDGKSKEFAVIKKLAKQFSVLFELDGKQNRDARIVLHKTGINFALKKSRDVLINPKKQGINLFYLEILSEFTNKLLKDEKLVVLKYLDDHLQDGMLYSQDDKWKPLTKYRNSLLQGEQKNQKEGDETIANPEVPSKSKSGKKKKAQRKSELSISKITLPRPSVNVNSNNLESNLIEIDDGISPIPSIEGSTPSLSLPEESNTGKNFTSSARMETSEIIEDSDEE